MEWSLSDAGCDGSDGAVASTSAVIGAMSSGRPPRKWGLPVGGQHSTRVLLLRPFNLSHVAWLYTYSTHPDSFIWERPDGAWIGSVPEASRIPALLDEHGIEFVPMVSGRAFQPLSGPTDPRGICWLTTSSSTRVSCSVAQIADTLSSLRNRLSTPVRFLMGQNEPWFTTSHNAMAAGEAAEIWRLYLQPAARLANLSLVSPNVQMYSIGWMRDFLRACYDRRDDAQAPCDVESVAAIAVHEYNCNEWFWRNNYGSNGGFRSGLASALGGHGGYDWSAYVAARPFWVTETNCNWEGGGFPGAVETCLRASGRQPSTHGRGSIATMNELDEISTYSWWTLSGSYPAGSRRHNVQIADADGCLLAPGQALVAANGGDPSLGCSTSCRPPPPPPPFQCPDVASLPTGCELNASQSASACACEYVWNDSCAAPTSVRLVCEGDG